MVFQNAIDIIGSIVGISRGSKFMVIFPWHRFDGIFHGHSNGCLMRLAQAPQDNGDGCGMFFQERMGREAEHGRRYQNLSMRRKPFRGVSTIHD